MVRTLSTQHTLSPERIYEFLEEKVLKYNTPEFIWNDPISIPHRFHLKQDIEIAGFFSALFAWGRRDTAIKKACELMALMNNKPYEFISKADTIHFKQLEPFVHRTFQGVDVLFLATALQNIYQTHPSMEEFFAQNHDGKNIGKTISAFRQNLLATPHLKRSVKHLPDPAKGSSAKRINLFLRWMIRKDKAGVDFGIWNSIDPRHLRLPLDVHSGKIARQLGLLSRKQNDWRAVEEVSSSLSTYDPKDPVKYDFALFGLGIYENWMPTAE